MQTRKGDALRRARHGAIIVGQFAQHACGFEASQRHQIDGRFGMTTTGQHAARLRAQREDVTRAVQIGWFRTISNRCTHGSQAVSRRHTGGYAMRRFNGHGEAGTKGAGVVFNHHRQIKLLATVFGDAQAYDAATVTDGQRHLLNGHVLGGKNHVAFVFTVFIVKHHHTAAFAQCIQCMFNTLS